MLGNLLGDFVKGSNFSSIPPEFHAGIRLHRQLDFFIDHNEHVLKIQRLIQDELPKVSGVSVDLVFDFLLASNWQHFSNKPMELFLDDFFDYAMAHTDRLPEPFQRFIASMAAEKYMYNYNKLMFLERAGSYLSKKLNYPNQLHRTKEVYESYAEEFQVAFFHFMDDAKAAFCRE